MIPGLSSFLRLANVLSVCIALVVPGVAALAGSGTTAHHDHSGHQRSSLELSAADLMDSTHVHSAVHTPQDENHALHGSDCDTALCCHIDAKYDGVNTSTYAARPSDAIDTLPRGSSSLMLTTPDRPPRFS